MSMRAIALVTTIAIVAISDARCMDYPRLVQLLKSSGISTDDLIFQLDCDVAPLSPPLCGRAIVYHATCPPSPANLTAIVADGSAALLHTTSDLMAAVRRGWVAADSDSCVMPYVLFFLSLTDEYYRILESSADLGRTASWMRCAEIGAAGCHSVDEQEWCKTLHDSGATTAALKALQEKYAAVIRAPRVSSRHAHFFAKSDAKLLECSAVVANNGSVELDCQTLARDLPTEW